MSELGDHPETVPLNNFKRRDVKEDCGNPRLKCKVNWFVDEELKSKVSFVSVQSAITSTTLPYGGLCSCLSLPLGHMLIRGGGACV